MGRKVAISFYDLDLDELDTKSLMGLISKHLGDLQQQKLSSLVGGEESPVFVAATIKQRVLMDKLKIKWDEHTSKDDASVLITEKMKKQENK